MILAINIENTNTVVGGIVDSKFVFVERLSTSFSRTELEYAVSFKYIFELHQIDVDNVEGAIISSVVPPVTNVIKDAVKRIFKKEALVIGPGVKTGLNIMTDHPAQVGSDMVATAVAAISKYKLPVIVINMETATTLSVINEKKQYIGGMIIPGIKVASESLSNEAAQLPKVSLGKPRKVIGTNTIDCMKSGLIYGTAAMLDGTISRIERELGNHTATIVATGENVKQILPYCERKMYLDEILLLDGLRLIYERNQKN